MKICHAGLDPASIFLDLFSAAYGPRIKCGVTGVKVWELLVRLCEVVPSTNAKSHPFSHNQFVKICHAGLDPASIFLDELFVRAYRSRIKCGVTVGNTGGVTGLVRWSFVR